MQRSSTLNPLPPSLYIIIVLIIFGLAVIPRLFQLDYFLMVDENLWYERSARFLQGLVSGNLVQTVQTGHPGVTTMWSGTIGLLLHYVQAALPGESLTGFADRMTTTPATLDTIRLLRLPLALLSASIVALAFVLGWRLLGIGAALAGAALMAFEPLFLAHSRVLHHDSPAADFSLLAVVSWLLYLKEGRHRYLLLAGASVGLAVLSKVSSVFLLGFAGLTLMPLLWHQRQDLWLGLRLAAARWLKLLGVTCLVVVLAWPAVWAAPGATWNTVVGFITHESGPHANGTFFMGHPIADAGLLYYPIGLAFALTPLTLAGLLLSLIGLGLAWYWAWRRDRAQADSSWQWVAWLWLYAALLITYMSLISKKQERYVLPSVVVFDLVAGWGYSQIPSFKSRLSKNHVTPVSSHRLLAVQGLLVLALLGGQFALAWSARPYYSTFYNPLLGGAQKAQQMLLIGRGEGLELAARFVQARTGDRMTQVASWYGTTVTVLFGDQVDVKDIGHPQYILGSDYVIFYINQLQRVLPNDTIIHYVERDAPIYAAQLSGIDFAYVYEGKAIAYPIDPFDPRNRLVGKASLTGVDLTGIPVAGAQVPVRLFWLNDGMQPGEQFYVRLTDVLEQDWAWGPCVSDPAFGEPTMWLDDDIIESECELVVYPGTPPGEYLLRVGIIDANGTVVGQIDLSEDEGTVIVGRPAEFPSDEWVPVEHRVQKPLGDDLVLIGHDSQLTTHKPGEVIPLVLYWRALREMDDSYTIRLSLEGGWPGQHAVWESAPVNGRYPTQSWQAGEVVRDPWRMTLPTSLPTGIYDLQLALIGEDGREAGRLALGSLAVEGREHAFTLEQPPAVTQRAQLGETIRLLGYDLGGAVVADSLIPGEELQVTLVWKAEATPDENYTVFVQLLDEVNQVHAQHDGQPDDGLLITTTWAPGEYVHDEHVLSLPQDLPSGDYRLIVGMYLPESGERLPVYDRTGQLSGDHITLGTLIHVP